MTEFFPGVVAVLRTLSTNSMLSESEITPNIARSSIAPTLAALSEVFGLVQQDNQRYRLLYPLQWLDTAHLAMALDGTVQKADEISSACDWARRASGTGFFLPSIKPPGADGAVVSG